MPKSDQQPPVLQRSLGYGLSLLLIWQPMLVAAADAVSPTHSTNGRPTLDQAANGVPIVNIQNPNGQGVSQNFYNELNVGSQGLILNNSQQLTQTQLGGYIEGNPNLTGGSANLILNEVIGTNPSSLNGYMEVGGARADVVVANPNGITCNGCGFINTNHATLTTGTAIMEGGNLSGFDVQGGNIHIGENGLNASNTSRFDLIARSVEVAGELHADQLNIVTGQQTVNRNTLEASNVTTDGDKPSFAIDSTALGGMYANRIRLIANEDGVGVRLDAPVAAQNGDLVLTSDGNIQHSDLAAAGDILISAEQGQVHSQGATLAKSDFSVTADEYLNEGAIVAEKGVTVSANSVTNTGTLGGREHLSVKADSILNDAGAALLSNNKISLEANSITNRLADIYTTGDISISAANNGSADVVENRSGRIEGLGNVSIFSGQVFNIRDVLDWEDTLYEGSLTYTCLECAREHFNMRYTLNEYFYRELDDASTGRSLLVAGNDLLVGGDTLVNEASDILSFGNMTLNVEELENVGLHSGEYVLTNNRTIIGIADDRHVDYVLWDVMPYNRNNYSGGAEYRGAGANPAAEIMWLVPNRNNPSYNPDNLIDSEDTQLFGYLKDGQGTKRPLESTEILGANIISGGDMDIEDSTIFNGDFGHREEEGRSEEEIIAVRDGSGSSYNYDSYFDGVNGGLFSIGDPDHPYLIETNPFFASQEGLLGSEYMLERLAWEPDNAIRLLGDGYYEQQLIRQQIIASTGRVFLSNEYTNENEQYRFLLENGAFAAEELQLSVGVALSPEQINKLTQDIVWMVEKEVAGEVVLVPQLYLTPQSIGVDDNGALIASGGHMLIDDSSIFNSGTIIYGDNADWSLNEGGMQNVGGTVTGNGYLNIDSEGDVVNVSGVLDGDKVAIKSARNIINRRFTRLHELQEQGRREWSTDIGKAAVIGGSESLALQSGGDIAISGSRLEGGEISLDADGNIVVQTVESKSGRSGSYHGGALSESSVAHLGSEISATMDIVAEAANDFSIIGSNISSDGTISLSSGDDMLIAAAQNSNSYDFRVRHDGETSHNIQRSVRQQGSEINGGGNVSLSAGNNLTAIASLLKSDEDLSLMAKGDLALLAANDSDYSYSYEENDSSFDRSRTLEIENRSQRQVGSLLQAGGQLSLKTETGNIDLVASNGYGAEGVSAESGGSINIISGVSSEFSRTQVTDKNLARVKTRDTGSINQTLAQAGLTSGADLSLNAQDDVTLGAAQLEAQGNLTIGEAAFAKDENGALKLDENGHPIIERGSIDNLNIGTVTLENESWSVRTRELRGPVKDLAKVSSAMIGLGALYMPGLALAGKESEIELSEHVESRVQQSRQVGSSLQAENVQLSAQNDIAVTGSSIAADQESGRVVVLAENILLDTAVTDTTTTQRDVTETASSIDPSLKEDEISLGGLRLTELEQATVIRDINHTGSSISANQIFLEAEGGITLINADLYATGEDGTLSLTGEEINITGVQDERTVSETLTEKTSELTLSVRNAYLDAAYAVKRIDEAAKAVDDAKDSLKDAERRVERGELAKEALEDYRVMLAAASANFVQVELGVMQALAAGATTAGTGFYASASAQHSETTSSSFSNEKTWQGSSLSASAMSINADKANIIGSDINAGLLVLDATDILIGAGTNEQSSSYQQETQTAGFSVSGSGAGSWNANVGFNEADSQSQATQYVNSQLNVGHLASNSESLTVKGGLITANSAEIETGALHIESLQDTYSSSNSSMGANLGIAGAGNERKPASGSAGFNMAEGSSEGARTNQQSAILVADGENSRVTARDTTLIGGMIANASYEESAEAGELALVDHGNLNFTTETLTVEDLRDYSKSEQQGVGLQVSNVGKQEYEGTREDLKGKEQTTGTTTVSLQNSGSRMEGQTLATIGAGNITVGGVSLDDHADYAILNRDINESQVVTLDQQTGALDLGVTVDHRLFSEVGRAEIVEQQLNSGTNAQIVISGVGGEISRGVDLGVRISGVDNPTVMREIINKRIGAWGILPTAQNYGGLLAQLPGQLLPGRDAHQQQMVIASADNPYMLANPELGWVPISETPGYHLMNSAQQAKLAGTMVSTNPLAIAAGTATYQNSTNGMLNTPALASYNAVTQTHDLLSNPEQSVLVTLNYNPSRGVIADAFESFQDVLSIEFGQSWMATNVAVDTGIFANQVMLARGDDHANFANHSQGNLLNYSGLLAVGLSKNIVFGPAANPNFTWNMFGSPVNADQFNDFLHSNGMLLSSSSVNSGDFVGQGLGGNHGLYVHGRDGQSFNVVQNFDPISQKLVVNWVTAMRLDQTQNQPGWGSVGALFAGDGSSPHSNYSCVTRCGAQAP